MVQLCNQMEKGFSTNLAKLRVVARRFLYYAATSLFRVYLRPMVAVKAFNATITTRTKNLTTYFHILKKLNLITNYRQHFMTMKANFKYDQAFLIKKTINNKKRNNGDETVLLLVREYCRLSKLLEPSESDIERISAILQLAQYDSELNSLINEADHLIAYDLGLSQEHEEFHTNFMVSEQENKEICCESTTISDFINSGYPLLFVCARHNL
jgi:hypothetical protein